MENLSKEIEFIKKNKAEITELKNSRVSGVCMSATKKLTFVSSESQEGKMRMRSKKYSNNELLKTSKTKKSHKPTKQIHTKISHN